MIKSCIIDEIYYQYNKGEMDFKTLSNDLSKIVFNHYVFFGIDKIEEDDLVDFTSYLFERLEHLLINYDNKRGKFSTFFQVFVRGSFLSWKKITGKEKLKNIALINCCMSIPELDEKINLYSPDKNIYNYVQEIQPVYNSYRQKKEPYTINNEDLLIVTLKSAYYLTGTQIELIAKQLGWTYEKLNNLINLVIEKLNYKINKKNNLLQSVNRNYIKLKERKILIAQKEDDPFKQKILQNEFEEIKERLDKKVQELKNIKIVPSDRFIADLLHSTTNKIRYSLRKNFKIYNIQYKTAE